MQICCIRRFILRSFFVQGGWQTLLLYKILHCKCKYLVQVFSFQKIFASCEYFLCRGDGKRCCCTRFCIVNANILYEFFLFKKYSHHVNIFCAGGDGKRCCCTRFCIVNANILYEFFLFKKYSHHVNIFCAGGMANAAVETHVDFRIIFKNLFGNLHADSEKYFWIFFIICAGKGVVANDDDKKSVCNAILQIVFFIILGHWNLLAQCLASGKAFRKLEAMSCFTALGGLGEDWDKSRTLVRRLTNVSALVEKPKPGAEEVTPEGQICRSVENLRHNAEAVLPLAIKMKGQFSKIPEIQALEDELTIAFTKVGKVATKQVLNEQAWSLRYMWGVLKHLCYRKQPPRVPWLLLTCFFGTGVWN